MNKKALAFLFNWDLLSFCKIKWYVAGPLLYSGHCKRVQFKNYLISQPKHMFKTDVTYLDLYFVFCLIWIFRSHHQCFSYVGTCLPGLNHYKARITNVSCSRTQRSDAGETRTSRPLVSSQALYHWATAFRIILHVLLDTIELDGKRTQQHARYN